MKQLSRLNKYVGTFYVETQKNFTNKIDKFLREILNSA